MNASSEYIVMNDNVNPSFILIINLNQLVIYDITGVIEG